MLVFFQDDFGAMGFAVAFFKRIDTLVGFRNQSWNERRSLVVVSRVFKEPCCQETE
jgi:hypothetical protein